MDSSAGKDLEEWRNEAQRIMNMFDATPKDLTAQLQRSYLDQVEAFRNRKRPPSVAARQAAVDSFFEACIYMLKCNPMSLANARLQIQQLYGIAGGHVARMGDD